jgi:hypothetical protein
MSYEQTSFYSVSAFSDGYADKINSEVKNTKIKLRRSERIRKQKKKNSTTK